MTTTTVRTPEPDLERFDRLERFVHWTTAGLFGVLMLTGAALYAVTIAAAVAHHQPAPTLASIKRHRPRKPSVSGAPMKLSAPSVIARPASGARLPKPSKLVTAV